MISLIDFKKIEKEIRETIDGILHNLKEKNQHDYFLFLSNSEYDKSLENNNLNLNPYSFDNRLSLYKDSPRMIFLADFLSRCYSFPTHQTQTDDNEYRMHIEMMIYCHIWEASNFLKILYRLAHLSNDKPYEWDVPTTSKNKFIRIGIKQTFAKKNNNMAEIIEKGYHSSLRNAFAHSEYYFDFFKENNRIVLDNNKNADWELSEISYDDWRKRFVYSALLSYHLFDVIHGHRINIIENIGKDRILIKHPSKKNGSNDIWLKYEKDNDRFSFV